MTTERISNRNVEAAIVNGMNPVMALNVWGTEICDKCRLPFEDHEEKFNDEEVWYECPPREAAVTERPKMEIGNVWVHPHQPNLIHYILHWTDEEGAEQQRHLVDEIDTALAKILKTRLK